MAEDAIPYNNRAASIKEILRKLYIANMESGKKNLYTKR